MALPRVQLNDKIIPEPEFPKEREIQELYAKRQPGRPSEA